MLTSPTKTPKLDIIIECQILWGQSITNKNNSNSSNPKPASYDFYFREVVLKLVTHVLFLSSIKFQCCKSGSFKKNIYIYISPFIITFEIDLEVFKTND